MPREVKPALALMYSRLDLICSDILSSERRSAMPISVTIVASPSISSAAHRSRGLATGVSERRELNVWVKSQSAITELLRPSSRSGKKQVGSGFGNTATSAAEAGAAAA